MASRALFPVTAPTGLLTGGRAARTSPASLSSRVPLPRYSASTFFARPGAQKAGKLVHSSLCAGALQRSALPRTPSAQLATGDRLRVFPSVHNTLLANATGPRRFFAAAVGEKATQALQSTGSSAAPSRPSQGNSAQFQPSVADKARGALGVGFLHPSKMIGFAATYLLNFRFYFIVFGEVMKLVLATMSSGLFSFLFSFVLAFEVFYFFLQCYISYTFLTMFFTVLF
ncbi:hypothetical protein NCLIV_054440 [Neospora caninum Liverpool]|uniref:Transmembrane protein n=1 Tax=Neospora caninum (strain Liverpool) TaxID=572307 RepID=F0VMS2_NEOCL|nr:hypothetical protein NCLIV_054440 [Neospora caninum Liverpool]CBZ55018.1 hypothetical protein NCLIV_054440 [Neospora caninum Liverpool]CEL69743.1 TPA: hypothetical protein BN1204_054440 [Neospora caninum Liverpool]|eukprot:XP_003885046.1 hypothetical protein NCLIV_054440 [Neospora caninum Liverpool]